MHFKITLAWVIVLLLFLIACSFPGRTGKKIYVDLFGQPTGNCVQVMNSRDARALDDCCLWLHFKTCPTELHRILSQVPYSITPMTKTAMETEFPDPSSINENLISSDPPKWWILKKLGDSCLKYEYFHPKKDYAQFAYVSYDSTQVFYHDAAW